MYVEVKSVTLVEEISGGERIALFPDTVSKRALRHTQHLTQVCPNLPCITLLVNHILGSSVLQSLEPLQGSITQRWVVPSEAVMHVFNSQYPVRLLLLRTATALAAQASVLSIEVDSGQWLCSVICHPHVTAVGFVTAVCHAQLAREGHSAALVYVIQRGDCTAFAPCHTKDPDYGLAVLEATRAGVQVLALACTWQPSPCQTAATLTFEGWAQLNLTYGLPSLVGASAS